MKRRVPLILRMAKFLMGFKLTPIGRIAVLGIFVSAVGGVTVDIPIYQIFCAFVCLFGTIEATGMLMRPKLEVFSWIPDTATAGQEVSGYFTIVNKGWVPACDIMCAFFGMPKGVKHVDADRVIASIPHGEQATLPFTILASQRGQYFLPEARIHSTFPFNLMRFGKNKLPECELRVRPDFHPLERCDLPFSRKSQSVGISVDGRTGNSPEFIGNREYVPGEPVRRLDFKAWARAGRPIVREFQDEFSNEVAIVLDTHLPKKNLTSRRDRKELEAAIELTAAVTQFIDQCESQINAFVAGPDLYLFQPVAETTHFESVLDILTDVDLSRQDYYADLIPEIGERLEDAAIVVCIFLDWTESREQFVQELLANGFAVKVIIVNDGRRSTVEPEFVSDFVLVNSQAVLAGEVLEL